MAQITFNLSNEHAQRLVDAFGTRYQPETAPGVPNTETKAEFAKSELIKFIKTQVVMIERNKLKEQLTAGIVEIDIT